MTWRSGHGTGAGVPRIEVLPPDELPAPVPDLAAPVARRRNGTVDGKEAAKALGARGGEAKAKKARRYSAMHSALGLSRLAEDSAFAPYRNAGNAFVAEHLAALARQAGGEVGPGPASIVASAAVQLTASRYFSDRAAATGDAALFTLASTLANASRQNLLAAYELAVREAQARPQANTVEAMQRRILESGRKP